MKSESTWKVDLESVASGEFRSGMIRKRFRIRYELPVLSDDSASGQRITMTKLLRIMDLIQINMKGSDRSDFESLENMFCGFTAAVEIEKKSLYAGIGSGKTSVRISHTY